MAYDTLLSQKEVDILLSEIHGEETVRTDPAINARHEGVQRYELGSTDRVVRRRMQTLELINERFIRHLRSVLLSMMRRTADVSVGAISALKYSEFERNLPVPCNLNMVKLEPLRGTALFAFDPTLVSMVIDTMFGGTAQGGARIEGRDFTATEMKIIKRLLDQTMACYTRAWEDVYPLQYTYVRSEMHTKFASVTDANDIVIVTPIRIEFGSVGGYLNICLPYSMVEPIRNILTNSHKEVDERSVDSGWTNQLSDQVRNADVSLVAEFARIEITLGELGTLEKGSILSFEPPETITAFINEVPALKCGYGISKNRFALEVQEHLQAPDFNYLAEKRNDD